MYKISRMQKARASARFKKGDFEPYRVFRIRGQMRIVFQPCR